MARTDNLSNFLSDVAESIKEKKGINAKIPANKFDEEIASIVGGSEPKLQSKEFRPQNKAQRITPDTGYDGLSDVLVYGMSLQNKEVTPKTTEQQIKCDTGYDALNTVTVKAVTSSIDSNIVSANIRKGATILGVEGSVEAGIEPTGTIDIASNGTYDVSNYATANVNVGEQTITKGFIINEFDSNGFAVDVSLVGIIRVPNYFFSSYNTTYLNALNKRLTKVSSTTATTINSNCFYGCTELTTINMPQLQIINDYAFYGCTKLETITLPDTLTTIYARAFYNCRKLNITSLPNSLTTLGDYVFYGCSAITSITLPSSLNQIGRNCFTSCSGLQEVYFEGNTALGYQTFYNCKNLTKIVYKNATSVPSCDGTTFDSSAVATDTCYIYVPDTLLEEWKATSGWSSHASQIKGLSELE